MCCLCFPMEWYLGSGVVGMSSSCLTMQVLAELLVFQEKDVDGDGRTTPQSQHLRIVREPGKVRLC